MGYPARRLTAEDREKLDLLPKLHFGASTKSIISSGSDPDNPTYISGVSLSPSSSAEFELLDASTGLVKNNSTRAFSMQGTVTYQLDGSGSASTLLLWSERSDDDGLTFTENENSLRTSEASNNSSSSQTKTSAVFLWKPGESIRWAMYKDGTGTVTLNSPSATVNGGNVVDGYSMFWQLNEV